MWKLPESLWPFPPICCHEHKCLHLAPEAQSWHPRDRNAVTGREPGPKDFLEPHRGGKTGSCFKPPVFCNSVTCNLIRIEKASPFQTAAAATGPGLQPWLAPGGPAPAVPAFHAVQDQNPIHQKAKYLAKAIKVTQT